MSERNTVEAPSGEELRVSLLPTECRGCTRPFIVADGPDCPYCGCDNKP